jgi:hypothetical protein
MPLFPLPACLAGKCTQADYTHWLYAKAAAHVRRDTKRGNPTCTEDSYRRAIHEAVCAGGDRDAFTGETLRWDLIRTYDNVASKAGGRLYKKHFALLPTVDHLDDGRGAPRFAICSWRTNDSKGDLTLEELAAFCRIFLLHQETSIHASARNPTGRGDFAPGITPRASSSVEPAAGHERADG